MNNKLSSIGIIGLGRMGYGIAANIISKSNKVIYVYDKDISKSLKLRSDFGTNCEVCSSLKDIVKKSTVILTCLPIPDISREVIIGKSGIAKLAIRGTIVVELSTLSPEESLLISVSCKKNGVFYLESPIKGRESDANLGIVHLEIGGTISLYRKVKPILELFAKKITYTGKIGSAATLKLLRNAPRYTNLILSFEILEIIKKIGLSRQHQKILLSGILDNVNWVWKKNIDNILAKKVSPSECIDIRTKDTLMIKKFVKKYGHFPVTELTHQIFSEYNLKKRDNVINLLENIK